MFDQGQYGEATAMATVLFGIVILLGLGTYGAAERGRA
jgi:ABC-type sugar transport system permease subunit